QHGRAVQMTAGLAITAALVPASTVLPTRPPARPPARPAQPLARVQPAHANGGPDPGARAPPPSAAPPGTPPSAPPTATPPSAPPTATPRSAPPSPHSSPVHLAARLGVVVNVTGVLKLGLVAVADVQVSDPGTAATKALSLTVSLPAGISLLGLGPGSADWS